MRLVVVALVCLPILCFFIVGGAPLIGDPTDTTDANTQVKINTESRQNYVQYANNFLHRPPNNHRYPYASKPGYYPYNYGHDYGHTFTGQQQGLMGVLENIADRDELNCVSKLLCDMASSGKRDNYGNKKPSGFINLDSLATLLSSIDDRLASPLVKFGKAFILGYTATQSSQCQYAYSHCPSDPDRLMQYLNNHNGGLFRLNNFLPLPPTSKRRIQSWGNRGQTANSFYIYDYNASGDKRQSAWQFPSSDDSQIHNYENDGAVIIHKMENRFPSEHKHENSKGTVLFS